MSASNIDDPNDPFNPFRSAPPSAKYYHLQKKAGVVWGDPRLATQMSRKMIERPDLEQAAVEYSNNVLAKEKKQNDDLKMAECVRSDKARKKHNQAQWRRARLEQASAQPVHVPPNDEQRALRNPRSKWNYNHIRTQPVDFGDWRDARESELATQHIEERVRERWNMEVDTIEQKQAEREEIYHSFKRKQRENRERMQMIPTMFVNDDSAPRTLARCESARVDELAKPKIKYEVTPDLPPDHQDFNKLRYTNPRPWAFERPAPVRKLTSSQSAGQLSTHAAAKSKAGAPLHPVHPGGSAGHTKEFGPASRIKPTPWNPRGMAIPGYLGSRPPKRAWKRSDWEEIEATEMHTELAAFERRLKSSTRVAGFSPYLTRTSITR